MSAPTATQYHASEWRFAAAEAREVDVTFSDDHGASAMVPAFADPSGGCRVRFARHAQAAGARPAASMPGSPSRPSAAAIRLRTGRCAS